MGKFKKGDWVYVCPERPVCSITHFIRAIITEDDPDPEWGYRLRAFKQDLPGIWMFNIWDQDLMPRTSKAMLKIPDDYNEQGREERIAERRKEIEESVNRFMEKNGLK